MEKFSKYQIKEQISKHLLAFLKQGTAPKASELDQQSCLQETIAITPYIPCPGLCKTKTNRVDQLSRPIE